MESPFRGRRVVVIGAGGFIGSHVAERLASAGADVFAVLRREFYSTAMLARTTVVRADACSVADMAAVLRAGDLVYALAGRSGAAASVADPIGDLTANCGSMLALLEAASRLDPRPRIVFAGSRLQYGRVATLPVDEDHPMVPTSPYGLHKTFCERYLAYYHQAFGISYAVARLTNPYGSTQPQSDRSYNVLDQIVRQSLRGESVTVYGDGAQLRDYVHIDDVVDALLLLGSRTENAVVNIGSGSGVTFRDAVEAIVARTGGTLSSVPWPEAALAVETGSFVASIERARALGFVPRVSFAEGIERSIIARSPEVTR